MAYPAKPVLVTPLAGDPESVLAGPTLQVGKNRLRLRTCGTSEAGKRTLISRLLQEPGHHIVDAPRGTSMADVLMLLVDAQLGVGTQTRRHAHLVSLLGIQHVIVAVNKMDLVGYDRQVFDAIHASFHDLAQRLGLDQVTAIPLSVLNGDNVTSHSARMSWYRGPSLMEILATLEAPRPSGDKLVFPVQEVNHSQEVGHAVYGTLASGQLVVGDEVRITASGEVARLVRMAASDGDLTHAHAGDTITLVLDRDVAAVRGDVLARADQPLEMTDQFEAMLIWMAEEPGLMGRTYEFQLASQWANASITTLKYRVDLNTLAHEACRQLELHDIAATNLALSQPLVLDAYAASRTLGSFILVDKFTRATVATGWVKHNLRRAQNVQRQALSITRQDRERLNGHKGKVIWLTGLSGSGKSTLANALEQELHAQGRHTYILDGDNIRQGLNKDLGFTDADRVENIRRIAEVAKLMMDAGLIVMTAFISPFRAEREMARELIQDENFIEVFVDTPLAVCEQRDPKGLYKKARSGQIPNMTGINSPYEPPINPEIRFSSNSSLADILRHL